MLRMILIPTLTQALKIPSTYNDMKVSMFWQGGDAFPCLKGKAAEVKCLVRPLQMVVNKYLGNAEQCDRWIKKLMEMCVRLEDVLEKHNHEYRFPLDARTEFKDAAYAVAQLNTSLGAFFHPQRIVLFNHTIKFHYILHIGHTAEYMNPRLAWRYSGEDLLQRVRQIVQSCHRGSNPGIVPPKVMMKYVQGLGFRMMDAPWM